MEFLTTSITHLPELVITVMTVLGGQKGFEIYKRKRYSNGGNDRRSNSGNHNSFSKSDKEFIEGCFKHQTQESAVGAKINRLELITELGEIIRDEGKSTRETVRAR